MRETNAQSAEIDIVRFSVGESEATIISAKSS